MSQTFKRTFPISRLYFKFIHHEPDLRATGVTALEIGRALEAQGFIQLIESDSRYIEMPKCFNPVHKRDFFKIIYKTALDRNKGPDL